MLLVTLQPYEGREDVPEANEKHFHHDRLMRRGCLFDNHWTIGERNEMVRPILPAASLSTADRLPAKWVAAWLGPNWLICTALPPVRAVNRGFSLLSGRRVRARPEFRPSRPCAPERARRHERSPQTPAWPRDRHRTAAVARQHRRLATSPGRSPAGRSS